nr:hypothetical protein [Tanacetum cinerariifolium]
MPRANSSLLRPLWKDKVSTKEHPDGPIRICLGRGKGKIELEVVFGDREKKLMVEKETYRDTPLAEVKSEVSLTKDILVNPLYPEQLEPSEKTGVPRRIIEHVLNYNPSIEQLCQKQRVLAPNRSQAVVKEVEEWLKASLVWPVKYPTHGGRECHSPDEIKGEAVSGALCQRPAHQTVLSKAQTLGKLAKYSVELGTYNINYEPRNAIKGQVLADFLSEALVGTQPKVFFQVPAKMQEKDDTKKWTLFTDEASNSKGFNAGLVIINPNDMEFTYALRLNFTSKNNEAEYEALLQSYVWP